MLDYWLRLAGSLLQKDIVGLCDVRFSHYNVIDNTIDMQDYSR